MAMVEITAVEVTREAVIITANELESLLMADDLFEDSEAEEVQYSFDRKSKGNMVYLLKIVRGQKKCQTGKSMGEKLELLAKFGAILTLSDNFRIKK